MSTLSFERQSPSAPAESSLDWLVSPLSKKEFFEKYWEKRPLVIKRSEANYFSQLLSFEEVDRVLTTLDRRYPDILLKDANKSITAEDYTVAGGTVDVARLYQLFEEGSTITLAYLDTVVPPLTLFCRALEKEFSFPFQTNVYMTPPRAQGAKPHYDTHDVFVLQVAGSKRWTIFGTPVESPLPGQDFDPDLHELGAPTMDFQLDAGDVAYIPRGVAHEARSTDAVSLHITTGILRYTWADLLLEVIAAASLNEPVFRKALPPGFARIGFDRVEAVKSAQKLLQQACTTENFDGALNQFVDRFMTQCAPVLEGQMAQMERLPELTLESIVGVRPGVITRMESSGQTVTVHSFGRKTAFPSRVREAVRFALSHSRFPVSALPGNLDEAGKLTIVRRLIREGLVVALWH
jgi:ribosomal protein L16 Arg81 hydroxylase